MVFEGLLVLIESRGQEWDRWCSFAPGDLESTEASSPGFLEGESERPTVQEPQWKKDGSWVHMDGALLGSQRSCSSRDLA